VHYWSHPITKEHFEGEGKMNKLTWLEVGMVTEPGQYESRFGLVEITADDLAIWKQYPRAAFTITGLSPHVGRANIASRLIRVAR
jgi:hypothetical protein